jgi:Phage tail protein
MTAPAGASYFPTIIKRYPAGSITPAGAYHLLADHIPTMKYRSYDNTTVFAVYGGEAIYDPTMPESVQVTDIKGLIPPWQNITQKGATQDGATYIDSLYDPIEVDITVRIRGRDGKHTRQVQRDWIAAWDAKQPGTLSWFSHTLGYWWAPVQLNKAPVDKLTGGNWLPQSFIWPAIAYTAFWQSFDCVDSFGFTYTSSGGTDSFTTTTSEGVTGWTITYSALGGWLKESAQAALTVLDIPISTPSGGGMVQWVNDPDNPIGVDGVDVVAINSTYISDSDDQVVSVRLGSVPTWFVYGAAYNDIWFRCPPPGTVAPGVTGMRLRIGSGTLRLSYFIDSVETVLRQRSLLIPPLPGEIWTVICSDYTFTIQRGILIGQSTVVSVTDGAQGSPKGSGYRAAGFGMHVSPDTIPAGVLEWTAGDNTAVTQSGYITMVNAGDQPMYPRFTLYGPGTFVLGDGPNNAGNNVTMGPLLPNQIVQLRTDPRNRGVTDLTSQPASPQALSLWQTALEDFLSLALGNNTTPLVAAIESEFDVPAPQGNIYSLLNGRFSDNSGIPGRPVAGPLASYEIPVSITGGNANSRIVAAGTPLRRFPY